MRVFEIAGTIFLRKPPSGRFHQTDNLNGGTVSDGSENEKKKKKKEKEKEKKKKNLKLSPRRFF
jgi:hypothetical protein